MDLQAAEPRNSNIRLDIYNEALSKYRVSLILPSAIEFGQLTKDSNLRNQSERQKEGEKARKKEKKLKRR